MEWLEAAGMPKDQAERDADWAVMRKWFPEGALLKVIATTDDGRIIVRWKDPENPGFVNEAALQVATRFALCCFIERDEQ